MRFRWLIAAVLVATLHAAPAAAQIPGYDSKQFKIEQIDANHLRLTGQVEIENVEVKGQKFYANIVDLYTDTHRLEASGNVLYETATARIAAERMVFNTRAGTGTFYTASGLAAIGARADKSMFGALEPDVYFYGDLLEKIGEDKYKVTKGGFTTCVQPTPRWELVAGSMTINVGEYAVLRNAVMKVKDVPVFYLPILYYPIQDDDRATGFLLPTYGRSTYQGQSVSNLFFWAISRSQDLSVMHDWYTARGQGYGSEYRWVTTPTSSGNLRAYRLSQKAANVGGIDFPETKSVLVNGSITQDLPFRLKGRALIDYSSSFNSNQLYSRDIFNATQSISRINGSVTGSWNFVNASLTANRQQQFFSTEQSVVSGSLPSLTASVSSRRLGKLPVFFSVQSEATRQIYIDKTNEPEVDLSLSKFDLTPSLRAPLSKLPFLTANLNLSYRTTRYSESIDDDGVQVAEPYTRKYAEIRADFLGPVFSKVYTPNNFLAERLKHVIEPAFSIQRVTAIEGEERVVALPTAYDRVVGGVTRMTYGLTNRVLVRKAAKDPAAKLVSAPRELLTASITQSYYSEKRASQFDPAYVSSNSVNGNVIVQSVRPPSNYSPVAMQLRTQPLQYFGASVRSEYDYATKKVLSVSSGADFTTPATTVRLSWSKSLSSYYPTNSVNGNTHLNFMQGRLGGDYSINWDVQRGVVLQQRMMAFYNAQCCGLLVEYSQYNPYIGSALPTDRRFNLGFTLAGIGTFSNFFGNFGGRSY